MHLALFLCLGGPGESVGLQAGVAQSVVRSPVADAHVVVLVDVDRLEQRLVAQPAVRVVGVGIDVGDVGQQLERVIEIRARLRVVTVVRGDPVSDRLQRGRDPVLFLLEEIERNRASVVGVEQLLLFALFASVTVRIPVPQISIAS